MCEAMLLPSNELPRLTATTIARGQQAGFIASYIKPDTAPFHHWLILSSARFYKVGLQASPTGGSRRASNGIVFSCRTSQWWRYQSWTSLRTYAKRVRRKKFASQSNDPSSDEPLRLRSVTVVLST